MSNDYLFANVPPAKDLTQLRDNVDVTINRIAQALNRRIKNLADQISNTTVEAPEPSPMYFTGNNVAAVEGPQGAQGEQGSQGAQGPQGDPNGLQGPPGEQGPQGVQGPQGDTFGVQGPQGEQGSQGATGAQGPQGSVGPQGLRGYQGYQGVQGSQGSQGAVPNIQSHVVAIQPNAGEWNFIVDPLVTGSGVDLSWAIAIPDLTGATGGTGPQGPVGLQGPRGYQGYQGFQGTTGAVGPPPTLIAGDPICYDLTPESEPTAGVSVLGSNGTYELQFSFGIPRGYQGTTGETGVAGEQGPEGSQGVQGPQGSQGEPADQTQLDTLTSQMNDVWGSMPSWNQAATDASNALNNAGMAYQAAQDAQTDADTAIYNAGIAYETAQNASIAAANAQTTAENVSAEVSQLGGSVQWMLDHWYD